MIRYIAARYGQPLITTQFSNMVNTQYYLQLNCATCRACDKILAASFKKSYIKNSFNILKYKNKENINNQNTQFVGTFLRKEWAGLRTNVT